VRHDERASSAGGVPALHAVALFGSDAVGRGRAWV
jgi:hypothetical protein